MEFFIYVDSLNGTDSNLGDILHPLKTISAAYNYAMPGATIVLQNGDSTSYGDLNISKNINIIAAYGTSPLVGTLTVTKAQCFIQGLIFSTLNKGIVVNNDPFGSVQIKDCSFNKVLTGIEINDTDYIAIHTNTFNGDTGVIPATVYKGIVINSAKEVNISNNTFSDQIRAIEVSDIYRLDIWNNTIYGGGPIPGSSTPSHDNLRVVYFTINSIEILAKRVILPTFATENDLIVGIYDVLTNSVNGPALDYGVDFIITGNGLTLSWDGYALEGQLKVGDILRVMYVEGADIAGGDAIRAIGVVDPNSTIDSNNINGYVDEKVPIQYGIFFNSPLKVKNNNFYYANGSVISGGKPAGPYYIGTASEDANNIGSDNINLQPDVRYKDDPRYVDPANRNFYLSSLYNPDIDNGEKERWELLAYEMGLTGSDAGVTAIGSITREGIAPFNNNLDLNKVNRTTFNRDILDFGQPVKGIPDIGAFEFTYPGLTGQAITGPMGPMFPVSGLGYTGVLNSYFVGETGSDYGAPYGGTPYGIPPSKPFASIDRAFEADIPSRTELYVDVAGITGLPNGTRYGRYFSKEFDLNDLTINTNRGTNQDIIYVYPTTPEYTVGAAYVSPNGSDGGTGIIGYTGIFGETGSIIYGFTGGNGTAAMPYRTITKAIQSGGADYIIVEPGFYPTFSGITGISIIGISKTNTIALNTPSYQRMKTSDWGITGTGTATFSNNSLSTTGTEYVLSNFTADNRLEYKSVVNINSNTFILKLDNVNNYVSIIFDSTSVKIKFYNGTTYTYNYAFNDLGVDVKIRVVISGPNVEVYINGPTTSIYREFLLISSYIGSWSVFYETIGGTETSISKFFISSGTITFVSPDTETNVRHKLYGLFGSKTL